MVLKEQQKLIQIGGSVTTIYKNLKNFPANFFLRCVSPFLKENPLATAILLEKLCVFGRCCAAALVLLSIAPQRLSAVLLKDYTIRF